MMHWNNPVRWGDRDYRSYTAGMALAAPFAAATLPYPWMLLAAALGIPFVVQMARQGLSLPGIRQVPLLAWLIAILGLLHGYGLLVGATTYGLRVLIDLIIVFACLAVFLLGRSPCCDGEDLVRGFFRALFPFALVAAVAGLVKASLLERGFLLGFLLDLYPDQYPSGSSLRSDYNLFGLSMIVAGLRSVIMLPSLYHNRSRMVFEMSALAVVLSAGLLTASRRFMLFSMFVPLLWSTIGFLTLPRHEFPRKVLLPLLGTACIVGCIFWIVDSPTKTQTATVLYLFAPEERISDFTIRKTDPGTLIRVMGTIQENYVYGFDTRIAKWRLGLDLLATGNWVWGIGFSYHELFSCRFTGCTFLDYPHFPLLSEWLTGGIAGALTAAAIYGLLFTSILRSGWRGWTSGSSAIAVAVLPYSLLSGDTLFSIPQFIIVCLLAQSQAETGSASDEKE